MSSRSPGPSQAGSFLRLLSTVRTDDLYYEKVLVAWNRGWLGTCNLPHYHADTVPGLQP